MVRSTFYLSREATERLNDLRAQLRERGFANVPPHHVLMALIADAELDAVERRLKLDYGTDS
jgi:hypothetical protein